MATEEPKGTTLEDINEEISMNTGPITTVSGGEKVPLTRRLAIVQALATHSDTKGEDKFKVFDLGMRFEKANGQVLIDSKESELIKAALEEAWPQPGIYVPLCRWLEGE